MKAYKINISLNTVEPKVWRQAIIPADITFRRLSAILNDIIGWMGENLFTLMAPDGQSVSGMPDGSEVDLPAGMIPGMEQRIQTIDTMFDSNEELLYIYNLSEPWEHRILIEECIPDYPADYPCVIEGEGACPPESCGGPVRFMEIMNCPSDVEMELRDRYLEEAEPFDAASVNEYLEFLYNSENLLLQGDIEDSHWDKENTEPLPDLKQSLENYRAEDLKEICRELGGSDCSRLSKDALINLTAELLTDEIRMEGALCDMQDEQMDFFTALCENPFHFLDLEETARAQADEFLCRGYVYQTVSGVYFVPSEIIKCYERMDQDSFRKKRMRTRRILDYCLAGVHFYGVIETDRLVEIFNHQNSEPVTRELLMRLLAFEMRHGNCRIQWTPDYFYLGELDDEDVEWILCQQEGTPYCILPEQEFLKYADFYYCENTLAWQRVKHFFKYEMHLEDFEGEILCHQLQELVRVGTDLEDVLEIPEAAASVRMDEMQMNHFMELVSDARNSTRLMEYRGFTPNEMQARKHENLRTQDLPDNVTPFPGTTPLS